MTVLGMPALLTVAEYAALGETERGYTELQAGRLLMSPNPGPAHSVASGQLAFQLDEQSPPRCEVIHGVDIDLELAAPDKPGFARRPDLIVTRRESLARAQESSGFIRGVEVVLAIEIVSPSSQRMDAVIKHSEYADAGIPNYWIVDIEGPVTLVACHLADELGYQNAPAATGRFTTSEPFPVTIDLDRLTS